MSIGARFVRRFFVCAAPLTLALLLLASCSDGPVTPSAASRLESVSGDAQPGFSGSPLEEPLVIRVLDDNNTPVPGVTVIWTVSSGGGAVSPSQTMSDQSGLTQATWTLGLSAGPQEARASISGVGTVTFTATATQIGETCDGSPFDLSVGGSVLLQGSQASQFCVAPGSRDYLAVAFNNSKVALGNMNVELVAFGISPIIGPPNPEPGDPLAESAVNLQSVLVSQLRDYKFHTALRERERRDLVPLVGGGIRRMESRAPAGTASFSIANPSIGEIFTLNANAVNSCNVALNRSGRVVAISQRAVVVEDVGNPPGGFTTAEFQSIALTFDTLIYPTNVDNFGEPQDIDGNNRILIFYTKEVNELTPSGAPGGYVAGFFFARDLFPKLGSPSLTMCPTSNESEMVYLMVPDPTGAINGNVRQKDFVRTRTLATLAHEFTHLINSSRRLYVNTSSRYPESTWMEEALSHAAEELVFFKASNLNIGANLGNSAVSSSSRVINAFNDYQIENVLRTLSYFEEVSSNSAFQSDVDLETRGAGYWFLRYAVDRRGGIQSNTWRKLVAGPDTGFRNLDVALQADAMLWMRDWAVSHYVDDAVNGVSPRYRMPSWNLRSVAAGISPPEIYAIRPPAQLNGVSQTRSLTAGGAGYFRFGVSNGEGRVQVRVSGGTPPPSMSLIIVRTR